MKQKLISIHYDPSSKPKSDSSKTDQNADESAKMYKRIKPYWKILKCNDVIADETSGNEKGKRLRDSHSVNSRTAEESLKPVYNENEMKLCVEYHTNHQVMPGLSWGSLPVSLQRYSCCYIVAAIILEVNTRIYNALASRP